MGRVVLDASALLATLRSEAGRERVEPVLEGAVLSAVSLSEVVAKLVEDGVPEAAVREAIDRLELDIHPFDREQAYAAGALRRQTSRGLAFGDRACLALARGLGAVALTADRSWARLELDVSVELIR